MPVKDIFNELNSMSDEELLKAKKEFDSINARLKKLDWGDDDWPYKKGQRVEAEIDGEWVKAIYCDYDEDGGCCPYEVGYWDEDDDFETTWVEESEVKPL